MEQITGKQMREKRWAMVVIISRLLRILATRVQTSFHRLSRKNRQSLLKNWTLNSPANLKIQKRMALHPYIWNRCRRSPRIVSKHEKDSAVASLQTLFKLRIGVIPTVKEMSLFAQTSWQNRRMWTTLKLRYEISVVMEVVSAEICSHQSSTIIHDHSQHL